MYVIRFFCAMLLGLVLFGACDTTHTSSETKEPLQVSSIAISPSTIDLSFEYPARLKSIQSVNIYARVEGELLEQKVKEGTIVKKGDVLFVIDPARYKNRVETAQGQYESALANLNRTSRDWARIQALHKQGIFTIDQYDTSLYNYNVAKASLQSAKATLEDAKLDLSYTRVIANADGIMGMRNDDVGNIIGRGGQDILTTITQLSPIYAEFAIPNEDYAVMKNLQGNIKVFVLQSNGKTYHEIGKIDFVDSVLDTQTTSIKARAIIQNTDYALMPNDFVRVRLEGFDLSDMICIPQSALMQDSRGSFVYIAQENTAQIRYVTPGRILSNKQTPQKQILILSGLKSGDRLITSHIAQLKNGAPIALIKESIPNNQK